MFVVKRNGSKEELDVAKIREKIYDAYSDYPHLVKDTSDLEVQIGKIFSDGMKTSDIHDILIMTEREKIDVDKPEREYTAARFLLQKLYHEVYKNTGLNTYNVNTSDVEISNGFLEYIKLGVKHHLSDITLNEFTDDEILFLGLFIKPERDKLFKYIGLQVFYDRYLKAKLGSTDKYELPQWKFMTNMMCLFHKEDKNYNTKFVGSDNWYYDEFEKFQINFSKELFKFTHNKQFRLFLIVQAYNEISTFNSMTATPILSNANDKNNQLNSCYVGASDDNLENIMDGYRDQALLSKFGGGLGWYYWLRSKGDSIRGFKNASCGPMKFLKVSNDVLTTVDQTGIRKGSQSVYVDVFHPNIIDFIRGKRKGGDERERIRDLFPAICIPDLFMERVLNNGNWSFISPIDFPESVNIYGDEWSKRYEELEKTPGVVKDTMKARELWKEILEEAYSTGNPFLFFRDTVNDRNMLKNVSTIKSSNLCCITKDTIIPTIVDGVVVPRTVADLASGESFITQCISEDKILNPIKSNNEVKYSMNMSTKKAKAFLLEDKKKIITLVFNDGSKFKCTPDHPIYVDVRRRSDDDSVIRDVDNEERFKLIEAKDANGYHVISTSFIKLSDEQKKLLSLDTKSMSDVIKDFIVDKKELSNSDFDSKYNKCINILVYLSTYVYKYNNEDGKYYNDGAKVVAVIDNDEYEDVYDISVEDNHNFLVQINSNNYHTRYALVHNCEITIPTTFSEYHKELVLLNNETKEETTIVVPDEHLLEVKNRDEYVMIPAKVLPIGSTIILSDDNKSTEYEVLCRTNLLVKDGRIAVCTLSSVNLMNVNTEESISRSARILTRLLDNAIDTGFYPVKSARDTAIDTRSLGIGIMNEHGLIANKKYHFASKEHYKIISDIMYTLSRESILASIDLAKERGSFNSFKDSEWSKGRTPYEMWYNSKQGYQYLKNNRPELLTGLEEDQYNEMVTLISPLLKSHGIRNGNLLAIAPTGSISLIAGCTQSIDPVYNRKWLEENKSGFITVLAPKINLENYEYYKPAYEISNLDLVKVNSIRQRYVDQAISFNLFLDKSKKEMFKDESGKPISSGQYISQSYRLAHELGVKTTYYLRSKSPENEFKKDVSVMDRSVECDSCQ